MRERTGVIGFFEDIPALIVITIALGIFFVGALTAYTTHTRYQEHADFIRDGYKFSKSIRNYDGLKYDLNPQDSVFYAPKVTTLSVKNITNDLNVKYNFLIQINDVSDYPKKYSIEIKTSPIPETKSLKVGKTVVSSSVCILVSENEIHPAILTVAIWR
ncbi:MAG: hypothetical protein AB1779_10120 [Candidatus Thermoplasmatota archaeon]